MIGIALTGEQRRPFDAFGKLPSLPHSDIGLSAPSFCRVQRLLCLFCRAGPTVRQIRASPL
jgi:hypothetical protein